MIRLLNLGFVREGEVYWHPELQFTVRVEDDKIYYEETLITLTELEEKVEEAL